MANPTGPWRVRRQLIAWAAEGDPAKGRRPSQGALEGLESERLSGART